MGKKWEEFKRRRMERAIGKINFLRRGIIVILVGLFILVVGVALYLKLNTGTRFLTFILGFSGPFFFVGALWFRWHYTSRKRKMQKPSCMHVKNRIAKFDNHEAGDIPRNIPFFTLTNLHAFSWFFDCLFKRTERRRED